MCRIKDHCNRDGGVDGGGCGAGHAHRDGIAERRGRQAGELGTVTADDRQEEAQLDRRRRPAGCPRQQLLLSPPTPLVVLETGTGLPWRGRLRRRLSHACAEGRTEGRQVGLKTRGSNEESAFVRASERTRTQERTRARAFSHPPLSLSPSNPAVACFMP